MNALIDKARSLSDEDLAARVAELAAQARGVTVHLIAHLAEVEARGLHLAAGYGSMFTYCCDALRLSEHAAYHRIEAARAARRFPLILDWLAEGALNLTTVKLLARHLTDANHAALLESARGRSRSEVEAIVARLAPAPDVPTSVRKLPIAAPIPATAVPVTPVPAAAAAHAAAAPDEPLQLASVLSAAPASARADVKPLSPDRYKLQLTIGGETLEKLRQAKEMLRHAIPSGDEAQIIDRALTLLLADTAKKALAASDRPRPSAGPASGSREVPADVKRAVFLRDKGRCAFVGKGERRCGERAFLQFHHLRPFAEGGPATVENVALRCRPHNRYEWQLRSTAYGARDPLRSIQPPPRPSSPP